MSKFEKGDRVRIVREFESPQLKSVYDGMTGTIEDIFPNCVYKYFVRLDEGGDATVFYEVEHLKHPVIVITTDGVTTTATKRLGKKVLGTAYSKCAPADTFDYDTGVGLALARLCGFKIQIHEEEETPMPKEKPWPKKLVCVEANAYKDELCVGQVYSTVQSGVAKDFGHLRIKDGTSWGIRRHSDTEFRINNYPDYALFIPLIED